MSHQPGSLPPTSIFHAGVFRCYNGSGEALPAFSVARQTGFELGENGEHIIQLGKPNAYGSQYSHCITGMTAIPAGSYGLCQADYAVCKYDSGTPVVGENWGPISGEWTLYKRSGGWRVMGVVSSANKLVLVQRAPLLTLRAKLDFALPTGSSATASVWDADGTDTTYNITVYDQLPMASGTELASGLFVYPTWFEDWQKWIVKVSEDCEA